MYASRLVKGSIIMTCTMLCLLRTTIVVLVQTVLTSLTRIALASSLTQIFLIITGKIAHWAN